MTTIDTAQINLNAALVEETAARAAFTSASAALNAALASGDSAAYAAALRIRDNSRTALTWAVRKVSQRRAALKDAALNAAARRLA